MTINKDFDTRRKESVEDVRKWLAEMESKGLTINELDDRAELLRAVSRHLSESAMVQTSDLDLDALSPLSQFPFRPGFPGLPEIFGNTKV